MNHQGPVLPGRTLVMGILNVTPDSFSDGGRHQDLGLAIDHAERMVSEGADIVDVGGESTRPGSIPLTDEEEWARLEPVLRALSGRIKVSISVDTYKADIARRALAYGVHIINDIGGGLGNPDMLRVASDAKCTYVWMHNRRQPSPTPVRTLLEETRIGVSACLEAGIERQNLWIDPGIGFGKTPEQNLLVLQSLREYCNLGWPVLLGASRKRFIGDVLGADVNHRLEGSLAVAGWGVSQGVQVVRVHDVAETVKVCRVTEAIRDAEA